MWTIGKRIKQEREKLLRRIEKEQNRKGERKVDEKNRKNYRIEQGREVAVENRKNNRIEQEREKLLRITRKRIEQNRRKRSFCGLWRIGKKNRIREKQLNKIWQKNII